MKPRIVKCADCDTEFESAGPRAQHCPKCRKHRKREQRANFDKGVVRAIRNDNARLRRERINLKNARNARLRARDTEYAKLDVPVTTRVASNGRVVEVRGQPRIGSSCGTLHGTDASVARRYL